MLNISSVEGATSTADRTAPGVGFPVRYRPTFHRRLDRETQSWIVRALRIGCVLNIAVIDNAAVAVDDETVGSRFRTEQVRERVLYILENGKVVFHCFRVR